LKTSAVVEKMINLPSRELIVSGRPKWINKEVVFNVAARVHNAHVAVESRDLHRPQQARRVGAHRRSRALSVAHADAARDVDHDPVALPHNVSPLFAEPVRGGAIQALGHEVLVDRSLEVSSSSFLTIISIIQGVALALLAQNTFPRASLLVGIQSATLMLVLVVVFYYYLSMSILLRWAPSILDCFLPFGVASLEIPPAFFLGHVTAWNAWLCALWLFTCLGLYITIKWSPPSHFGEDRVAHRLLHRLLQELQLAVTGGGILAGLIAVLAIYWPAGRMWWGMAGAAAAAATVAIVVARMEIRVSQIHEHYGVNRPPFN
jgi:hypothetical protein